MALGAGMSGRVAIRVEDVWKQYRLGVISHASLQKDLQGWWARLRGRPDPNLRLDAAPADPSRVGEWFWALRGVSFDVCEGEVLGIVGRNGAGKSTLLKILSKVTTPTRGAVKVRGRIASLLEVGTGFHPELTGRENIFLNGAILGMSKAEIKRKLEEIVAFSEVGKFIDTPVKRYSSGMYVRLAFAVAAHLEPEILVVDEVLAVGDAAFQKKCLGKMEDIGRGGRTVLFVSHNLAAIQRLCTRTAWIDQGAIRQIGSSGETVHAYLGGSERPCGRADIDLRDWPERYGSGDAKIIAARLFNESRTLASTLFRNRGFSVEFDFVSSCTKSLHFTVQILSDSGVKLFHLSHLDDVSIEKHQVYLGVHTARVSIDRLYLCSGSYKFSLAIHTENFLALDVLTDVLPFTAEDDPNTTRSYDTIAENGYCWMPSAWSFRMMRENL
jgi:lipopolysaccharide transport system ATP-binding protein